MMMEELDKDRNCCPICGSVFEEVEDENECATCGEHSLRNELITEDDDYAWVI